MKLKHKFYFDSNTGKILKIEDFEYLNVNWEQWEKQVNQLVEWIDSNHPELNGFIYDLTMEGAINYLKAIELYRNRNKY